MRGLATSFRACEGIAYYTVAGHNQLLCHARAKLTDVAPYDVLLEALVLARYATHSGNDLLWSEPFLGRRAVNCSQASIWFYMIPLVPLIPQNFPCTLDSSWISCFRMSRCKHLELEGSEASMGRSGMIERS